MADPLDDVEFCSYDEGFITSIGQKLNRLIKLKPNILADALQSCRARGVEQYIDRLQYQRFCHDVYDRFTYGHRFRRCSLTPLYHQNSWVKIVD